MIKMGVEAKGQENKLLSNIEYSELVTLVLVCLIIIFYLLYRVSSEDKKIYNNTSIQQKQLQEVTAAVIKEEHTKIDMDDNCKEVKIIEHIQTDSIYITANPNENDDSKNEQLLQTPETISFEDIFKDMSWSYRYLDPLIQPGMDEVD